MGWIETHALSLRRMISFKKMLAKTTNERERTNNTIKVRARRNTLDQTYLRNMSHNESMDVQTIIVSLEKSMH